MRLHVDRDRCSGIGMCEAELPEVFEVGDDGLVVVHEEAPADDLLGLVQAACDACPTGALSVSAG